MIIVKLTGGLANQLFQYAMARRIALKNKSILKLDTKAFNNQNMDPARKYELDIFNINKNFATISDRLRAFIKYKKVREKHYHFDPAILNLSDNLYIDGYWQSEKYFQDIKDIIIKEFTLKDEYTDQLDLKLKNINFHNAISIHLRRGDYINNKKTNQYHGVCSLEYYKKSVKEICKKVTNPHFFIFSDNIEWSRKNLKIEHPTEYIDGNTNYEDLFFMSKCQHHIIANSSFSWWGAYLNNSNDKIVIAPKKWFNDPLINTNDLIPSSWIRI